MWGSKSGEECQEGGVLPVLHASNLSHVLAFPTARANILSCC
jgi:hypothetical protein